MRVEGKVLTPGPDRNMDTGMLLKELMNASMKADEIPEVTLGSTTLKNAAFLDVYKRQVLTLEPPTAWYQSGDTDGRS